MNLKNIENAVSIINSTLRQHCADIAFDLYVQGDITEEERNFISDLYIEIEAYLPDEDKPKKSAFKSGLIVRQYLGGQPSRKIRLTNESTDDGYPIWEAVILDGSLRGRMTAISEDDEYEIVEGDE
jgi:hypothetical protein